MWKSGIRLSNSCTYFSLYTVPHRNIKIVNFYEIFVKSPNVYGLRPFSTEHETEKDDKLKTSENTNKKENPVSETDNKQHSSASENSSTKKSGSKFKRYFYTSTFLIGIGAAGVAYLAHSNPSVRNGLTHHAPKVIEYLQKIPGFGEGNSKSNNEEGGHGVVIVENVKDEKSKKKVKNQANFYIYLVKLLKNMMMIVQKLYVDL